MGQRSHRHGPELVPRWWLVRQHSSNFISPEVATRWTGRLCSPPTSAIHLHKALSCEGLATRVDEEKVQIMAVGL